MVNGATISATLSMIFVAMSSSYFARFYYYDDKSIRHEKPRVLG